MAVNKVQKLRDRKNRSKFFGENGRYAVLFLKEGLGLTSILNRENSFRAVHIVFKNAIYLSDI